MAEGWRIVKKKWAADAFSGQGAGKMGGRWNSTGVQVVYLGGSKALTALETLVHLNPGMVLPHVSFRVRFAEALVDYISLDLLPFRWDSEPPTAASRDVGDAWVSEARSAVLAVPSVIIPGETNYLLNPLHPDFKKIEIGKPEPFAFDSRLIR